MRRIREKNQAAVAVIVLQGPTKTLLAFDIAITLADFVRWKRNGIIKSQMISLFVVMGGIFAKYVIKP
jgi:hypothetical protein